MQFKIEINTKASFIFTEQQYTGFIHTIFCPFVNNNLFKKLSILYMHS